MIGGSNDCVSTDILARAHLSKYLLRGPDRMDKVSLLLFLLFSNLKGFSYVGLESGHPLAVMQDILC